MSNHRDSYAARRGSGRKHRSATAWVARAWMAILVAPLAVLVPGKARAFDTCSCDAYFEVKIETRGPDFKPDVPQDHFTALKDKGALQTFNACRRDARDQAHSCMGHIWDNRHTPSNKPSQCSTTTGIRGLVPYDIKWGIERAACLTGSPIANVHNGVFKLYRRTTGDAGCGPNLTKHKEVFVSNYEVDCLSVRHREKLGNVAETQVTGIDRPGSNLSGSGVTAGNGSVGACKAACNLRGDCVAWTWVPPGIEGSELKCWVKGSVPWYKKYPESAEMVSGTRFHDIH